MGKYSRATKGQFLRSKLSKTKSQLVRNKFTTWLKNFKEAHGTPTKMTDDMLVEFFSHLGKTDSSFLELPGDAFDKKNPGTHQINEYMRKKIEKLEEKTVERPAPQTRKRTSPTKAAASTTEQKPIEEKPEVHHVTADGDVVHGDEKNVAYRKEQLSDSEMEPDEPNDSSLEGVTSHELSEAALAAETQQQHIKDLFCSMLDAQPKVALAFVGFTWTARNNCTLDIRAQAPDNQKN